MSKSTESPVAHKAHEITHSTHSSQLSCLFAREAHSHFEMATATATSPRKPAAGLEQLAPPDELDAPTTTEGTSTASGLAPASFARGIGKTQKPKKAIDPDTLALMAPGEIAQADARGDAKSLSDWLLTFARFALVENEHETVYKLTGDCIGNYPYDAPVARRVEYLKLYKIL